MLYTIIMVADVVNLRQERKRKARAAQSQLAAENRALHGRPLAQRRLDSAEDARQAKVHDGHRLTDHRRTGPSSTTDQNGEDGA